MRGFITLLILVMLQGVLVVPLVTADDTTFIVTAPSGRYSIELPNENWQVGSLPNTLEVRLIGEALHVTDGENAVTIKAHPSTAFVQEQHIPSQFLSVYYRIENATTDVDIEGRDRAFGDMPEGSYVIAVDARPLVYGIELHGPDTATLQQIADSFTVYDTFDTSISREPLSLLDGAVQVPLQMGWLSAYWDGVLSSNSLSAVEGDITSLPHSYVILPEVNEDTIRRVIFGRENEPLNTPMIEIISYPYDYLFGPTYTDPIGQPERMARYAEQIAIANAAPKDGFWLNESRDSVPYIWADMEQFYGENQVGRLIMLDIAQHFVFISIVAPAESYAPSLTDFIVNNLELNPYQNTHIGVQVGQEAPDFEVTLLDGQEILLSELRGKTVLLNFWFVNCRPCREEMPIFNEVAELRDDVVILAVDYRDSVAEIQPFVDELGLTFPIGLDPNGSLSALYRVIFYPTTYIINPEGVITAVPQFHELVTVDKVLAVLDR